METNQTSIDMKNLIVKLWKEKKSIRDIAEIVKKPHSTVHYVINNYKRYGFFHRPNGSGRPKKISSPQLERRILRFVKENPTISAVKIARELKETSVVNVHPQTVRNVFHSKEYRAYAPRKKPYLSARNVKKRLEYAKYYIAKSQDFWKSVIFTDESKFNLFGSDGRRFVWRKEGTALKSANIKVTVKHGGGSVMVWGAMAASGVGNLVFIDGTMDKMVYLNILKQNVPGTAVKLNLNRNFSFVQDNDPKHNARIVKEWLLYNVQKVLPHPPQSPDLNPIEHLWAFMEKKLREKKIKNKNELKSALQNIWDSVPTDFTEKLVLSMNKRLEAVIAAKGYHTKY